MLMTTTQTPPIACAPGDVFWIGPDVRVHLTGLVDDVVYLYLEAPCTHPLTGADGFHASAQCDDGICGHVLALLDGQQVCIGPVALRFEDAHWRVPGVQALRGIHLHIHTPDALPIRRSALMRARPPARRAAAVIEGVWRQPC
jgi:hypothetical protein